jgi:predicted DNA-binding antitoxin AbrB/MazE fold protein
MGRTIDAIYEKGVLKPLQDPGLAEHQRVVIDLYVEPETEAQATLRRWRDVYTGLSDEDIAEVEAIALDRSRFLPREP